VTRDEAIEMAAHVYGGLVECEHCHRCPLDDYLATIPSDDYDDLKFGLWLLDRGWKFEWREHDHEGGPRSGKFPFLYYSPERADSLSWSFTLTCPECVGQPAVP
jgi:hypothetical protein